ncbi:electron transfer flavoprotein beta subunit lysine methyltransferase-like [Lycorma delicatula]|uniref:electron transfer flavoprotein beta subunit lysine methyltransferase-like n=1 Tax=Lycorma delicatula TaxID=130591 RepID=UPI003F50D923
MKWSSVCMRVLQMNSMKSCTIKKIKECTMLSRDHLTPEIELHLITPDCYLWSASEEQSPFQDPFWAFYWPGGQALSRYVLDNKELVAGKRVLDVGSGSGACAISAAMSGAINVTANDIDYVSCVSIEINCNINNVFVEIISDNLVGSSCDLWDCLLVGDMFYDSEFGFKMFTWLKKLCLKDKLILVGDPGRHAFKETIIKNHLQCVAEYPLLKNTCLENTGFNTASVWKFVCDK